MQRPVAIPRPHKSANCSRSNYFLSTTQFFGGKVSCFLIIEMSGVLYPWAAFLAVFWDYWHCCFSWCLHPEICPLWKMTIPSVVVLYFLSSLGFPGPTRREGWSRRKGRKGNPPPNTGLCLWLLYNSPLCCPACLCLPHICPVSIQCAQNLLNQEAEPWGARKEGRRLHPRSNSSLV